MAFEDEVKSAIFTVQDLPYNGVNIIYAHCQVSNSLELQLPACEHS